MMEKSKPMTLGYQDLKKKANLITNAEYRCLQRGIGMVVSFAKTRSSLFTVKQPYRTDESRIMRILHGTGRVSVNLMEYDLKEQTFVITPPHALVEVLELTPDHDFQVIVPENDFLPSIQNSNLADLYGQYGTVLSLDTEEWELIGRFYSLIWESMHRTPFRPEVIQHLVLALLNEALCIRNQKQASTPPHLSRQEDILHRFLTLINKYGKRERNIAYYADKLCLTPRYLGTVIREASGQTVMQWINQAVILEAKVMLKHSDLLVYQISDELNFPNPSFFSKFFRRMTGMTPAEYQKSG